MNEQPRPNFRSLAWGLTLVAVGTIFLLDRLGVTNFHHPLATWWPLFIIAMGLSKLFDGRHSAWSSFWLIGVGCWLQATNLNLFGLSFGSSWPLLLIILGAGIVLRSLFDPHHSSRRRGRTWEGERHD